LSGKRKKRCFKESKMTIQVLAFDVFGTVVDWHSGVAREVDALNLAVSGAEFALQWRAGYQPAMARVRSGELGWTKIDDLHRLILDELLQRYGITHLSETQISRLNSAWHRLDPWPDVLPAFERLKKRHVVCSLSNGNLSLLTHMGKWGGLPWDCILSAEVFHAYKPDPRAYLGVAEVFSVAPSEVLLVAAHQDDCDGARQAGLQTAYVERPREFGQGQVKPCPRHASNTFHSTDLLDLADQLGC
jgi:2-haloacid dehalogenase